VNVQITAELLGALLDQHGAALSLYAAQWSPNADDCVQEAFLELARQAQLPDSPVAWLYRVVRNRAISDFRASRRRAHREQLAQRLLARDGQAAACGSAENITSEEVAAALAALPDEIRETLVARTWGGLNFEQIATLMGCATSTAHRRYEAGLSALRERLEPTCPATTTMHKASPSS
jgi:RNA polymerase sigma factor (sigma-70 family)